MHPEKPRRYSGWREEYRRKLVSPEGAARVVKLGDRVVLPCAFVGVTPQAIVQRRSELEEVALHFTSLLYDPGWFATDMSDTFKLVCEKYLNPIARPSHDEKRVQRHPRSHVRRELRSRLGGRLLRRRQRGVESHGRRPEDHHRRVSREPA